LWPFGVVFTKGWSTSLSLGFSFSALGFVVGVGTFGNFAASLASFSSRFASFLASKWLVTDDEKKRKGYLRSLSLDRVHPTL